MRRAAGSKNTSVGVFVEPDITGSAATAESKSKLACEEINGCSTESGDCQVQMRPNVSDNASGAKPHLQHLKLLNHSASPRDIVVHMVRYIHYSQIP
jgi:hypothetical protein